MLSGVLLPAPVFVAVDGDGAPISGALLQFYMTTTTTPTPVYADAGLTTPLANPVAADGSGQFPAIYLDPSVVYRMQLQNASASVLADIDPLSVDVAAATQTQVNAGVATGVYVSPATLAAWTGVAGALGYAPLNKAGDTATGLNIAAGNLAATAAGYLGAPVNEQDASYAFLAADAGKMVRANASSGIAYTIPPNTGVAFPVGACIAVRNVGAGVVTLTRGAGVTQVIAGSGTSKDVALAQWGLATLVQETANSWVVSGTGIS